MQPNQKIVRLAGALFLLQFVLGVIVNQVLLGPNTFASDYLTQVFHNENQVITGIFLGLLNGLLSITVALLLFAFFESLNKIWGVAYLSATLLAFAMILVDNGSISSLLALSESYSTGGNHVPELYNILGTISL